MTNTRTNIISSSIRNNIRNSPRRPLLLYRAKRLHSTMVLVVVWVVVSVSVELIAERFFVGDSYRLGAVI